MTGSRRERREASRLRPLRGVMVVLAVRGPVSMSAFWTVELWISGQIKITNHAQFCAGSRVQHKSLVTIELFKTKVTSGSFWPPFLVSRLDHTLVNGLGLGIRKKAGIVLLWA